MISLSTHDIPTTSELLFESKQLSSYSPASEPRHLCKSHSNHLFHRPKGRSYLTRYPISQIMTPIPMIVFICLHNFIQVDRNRIPLHDPDPIQVSLHSTSNHRYHNQPTNQRNISSSLATVYTSLESTLCMRLISSITTRPSGTKLPVSRLSSPLHCVFVPIASDSFHATCL